MAQKNNNKMMKFSILIASYNNGKYFKDCFISLINQTYNPLLLDYDFSFSTTDLMHVGEFGHREGNIKKLHLIAHRYTTYFKMSGSILKEELW